MKRRSSIGTLRNKCDKLMQIKGKELFPKSLLSDNPTQVMHHYIPKSVCSALRYDWDNLIPLTNGEHMRLHQSGDPYYEERIREIKGKAWQNRIREKRKMSVKINAEYYKRIYQELNERNTETISI